MLQVWDLRRWLSCVALLRRTCVPLQGLLDISLVKHRSPCTQDWGFLTRCKSCVMKWRLLSRGYGTARFWFRIVHADGRLLWFRRALGSSSILISDHM